MFTTRVSSSIPRSWSSAARIGRRTALETTRDAGLIIYNAEAAQYFEQIFLHDWVNMAAAKVLG
jgi:hypothetical protein